MTTRHNKFKGHESVSDLSHEAVTCRVLRHSWKPYTAEPITGTGISKGARLYKGFNVTVVCERCKTTKSFQLTQRGERSKAVYQYPKDYLLNHPITDDEKLDISWVVFDLPGTPHPVGTVTPIKAKRTKRHA